ncbi:peptidoglycan-binding domain-containing protein [Streptomyces hawaiiensis]|uniref:peptidoglycan-binding domain-containing protein n=1 Tax=Streptomyces hawaiiensis TaxID=67305 RepID=UPI003665F3FC
MKFHEKTSRAVAAVMGAAMVTTLGLAASPASAKASDGWVRGYDKYSDDWDDEGTMSTGTYANSNASCFWQKILWAERALYQYNGGGLPFSSGMIDGQFGSNTREATIHLQSRWGLPADGTVGKAELHKAMESVGKRSGSTDRGEKLNLYYLGDEHLFLLDRNEEGKYRFIDGDGGWRQAGYNYRSCS